MRPRPGSRSWGRWWDARQPGLGSARWWDLPCRSASSGCSWASPRDLQLSSLALDGSSAAATGHPPLAVRYLDLLLLALALPVFLIAGFPMLGYAVAAAAWITQNLLMRFAERRAAAALARGDRRSAMGSIGAATLGRVWLVTIAILLVGLLGDREDGLAAGILSAVLVTAHLGGTALARLSGDTGAEANA
jgi:hypothetical protein